jgi:hypothetical protein
MQQKTNKQNKSKHRSGSIQQTTKRLERKYAITRCSIQDLAQHKRALHTLTQRKKKPNGKEMTKTKQYKHATNDMVDTI